MDLVGSCAFRKRETVSHADIILTSIYTVKRVLVFTGLPRTCHHSPCRQLQVRSPVQQTSAEMVDARKNFTHLEVVFRGGGAVHRQQGPVRPTRPRSREPGAPPHQLGPVKNLHRLPCPPHTSPYPRPDAKTRKCVNKEYRKTKALSGSRQAGRQDRSCFQYATPRTNEWNMRLSNRDCSGKILL